MFQSRIMLFRSTAVAQGRQVRSLHSSPTARKTVKDKVSEVADGVNKKLGKGLASAIETGEEAANLAKEKLGATTEKTKESAQRASDVIGEKAGEAKSSTQEGAQRASQAAGDFKNQSASAARQTKQEFDHQVKK